MSRAKHTPRPWRVVAAKDHIQIHANGFTGSLARIDWNDERGRSDARLIAAAPMLLEAPQRYVAWDDTEEIRSDLTEAARAVISKALPSKEP